MKMIHYAETSPELLKAAAKRSHLNYDAAMAQIRPIVQAVRDEGDVALRRLTAKFDQVDVAFPLFSVEELEEPKLDPAVKTALDHAMARIHAFHEITKPKDFNYSYDDGSSLGRVFRPIESVGLYVPGGNAALPSTAMMLAIPASIAGCNRTVLATPPGKNGDIIPEIVYISKKCKVTSILKAGGAQAIAALAYGTQSIPAVDKIFGPGNSFVTAAKLLVQQECGVGIDLPAGPSEVMILADETAIPAFVAADLLSQAEHGPDSQVVLVAEPGFNLNLFLDELACQLRRLPRKDFAAKSLENGFILRTDDSSQSLRFANLYAPEHLILAISADKYTLNDIINAGSVFIGNYSPESAGDYATGPNHTLPTSGYARTFSGVSVESFGKQITWQSLTKAGLHSLSSTIITLARKEHLDGHAEAVSIRLSHQS